MARFITLPTLDGGTAIINAEAVSCVLPDETGARIYLRTNADDQIDVVVPFAELANLLGAQSAPGS